MQTAASADREERAVLKDYTKVGLQTQIHLDEAQHMKWPPCAVESETG